MDDGEIDACDILAPSLPPLGDCRSHAILGRRESSVRFEGLKEEGRGSWIGRETFGKRLGRYSAVIG